MKLPVDDTAWEFLHERETVCKNTSRHMNNEPRCVRITKKRREKISWHCPFKRIIHEIRWPIYDSRDLCISTSYSLKIAVITHLNLNFKETGDCKYGEAGRIFFLSAPVSLLELFKKVHHSSVWRIQNRHSCLCAIWVIIIIIGVITYPPFHTLQKSSVRRIFLDPAD